MEPQLNHLADLLVKENVRWAFGVTGSGPSLHLISRLEEKGISYIPASHEASAAIMAGAVARATGQIAVAISIKGPGLANLLAGQSANWFECAPVLSISEAFGEKTLISKQHKRLPQKALVTPLVKARVSLNQVSKNFRKLVATACAEMQGPVHIDLCEESAKEGVWFRKPHVGTFSSPDIFRKLSTTAKRPILIVGSLALRREWKKKLAEIRVPIFTTASAKGVLDESGAYAAGIYTGTGKELAPETKLLAESDLVIGLGLRNNEVVQAQSFGRPTVLFDEIVSDFSKGFDAKAVLDLSHSKVASALWPYLGRVEWGQNDIRRSLQEMRRYLLAYSWLPAHCFDALNQDTTNHALVLDTGSFCTIGEHMWQAKAGRSFLGSSNGRFMGTAIPTAIGFSLSQPNRPVYCVSGDGGFRMYPSEIKIAVEKKLPICFVLMRDGFYGSIACVPQKGPSSTNAVRLIQPSWAKSIEGMGLPSFCVSSQKEFEDAIHGWDRKEPRFVEAIFSPEDYRRMTERLR